MALNSDDIKDKPENVSIVGVSLGHTHTHTNTCKAGCREGCSLLRDRSLDH